MQWSKKQKNIFDPSPQRIYCLGGKKNIYAGSITMWIYIFLVLKIINTLYTLQFILFLNIYYLISSSK